MNEQPQNYNNGNRNAQIDCFGKIKSCYTNPDTPCQNYLMMFLTLFCVIVLIFVLYSLFAKGWFELYLMELILICSFAL